MKKLKSNKKLALATASALLTISTLLGTVGCVNSQQTDETRLAYSQQQTSTQTLKRLSIQELRQTQLPTYQQYFTENGERKMYDCVEEADVLKYCIQLKYALEDYYKSLGASDWCEPNRDKFWFDDIEYIVTAIAFKESTYRANLPVNSKGCSGLTCLNKHDVISSLHGWLGNSAIWGNDMPDVCLNENQIDILNPATCLEYTFLNIGYTCRNALQEDRKFTVQGSTYCLSDKISYDGDTITKLAVASHLFGIGNIAKATYGVHENGDTIGEYLNSQYVKDVMSKAQQLKLTYGDKYEIEAKSIGLSQ